MAKRKSRNRTIKKSDLWIGANKIDGKEKFYISYKHKFGQRHIPRDAGYLCTDGVIRRSAQPLDGSKSWTGYFDTIEDARRALEKYGV